VGARADKNRSPRRGEPAVRPEGGLAVAEACSCRGSIPPDRRGNEGSLMENQKRGRHRKVSTEPQLEWDFSVETEEAAVPEKRAAGRGVIFKEPKPTDIFVGNQRLDRFLREADLDDVIVMADLLASLDCWPAFEAGYVPGGRAPHHPRLHVGLILLGLMEGKSTLRDLEQLARSDVRAWWLCGGLWPDHSTVGKFVNRHRELLTGGFFEELTRKIIKATGSNASRLAGDGTVIEAMASRTSLLKQEAAEQAAAQARARANAARDDDELRREAELAEQVAKASRERNAQRRRKGKKNEDAQVSATEPDAVVQPQKNKTVRPSYKPSIVATEDRLIVGQGVDATNEAKMVAPMVAQAKRISGKDAEELLLDAGYFSAMVVLLCYSADISLLCPQGKSGGEGAKPKKSDKQIPKNQFRYDEQNDEYICPAGERLRPKERYRGTASDPGYVRYGCDHCDGCAHKPQCARGKGCRTIKRYEHDELLEALFLVMEHPQAQRVYAKRQGMVEPVFGEMRYIQGLLRFRRRGLDQVRVEFALHAAAHNVRRYLRLTARVSGEVKGSEEGLRHILTTMWLFFGLTAILGAHRRSSVTLFRVKL
jgi:transposase